MVRNSRNWLFLLVTSFAACATGGSGDGTGDDTPLVDATIAFDSAPDATVVYDAMPLLPPNTCGAAHDLTVGASGAGGITVAGDTTGFTNETQPPSSCTGYTPDGPDAIYKVTATAGQVLFASVDPVAWDASIFIASDCQFNATCLIGRDEGNPEAVQWNVATTGTYYVVVESWDAASFGAYSLTVTLQ